MSDALKTADLSSEALALIKGGAAADTEDRRAAVRTESLLDAEATIDDSNRAPKAVRPRRSQRDVLPEATGGQGHLSIRLPAEIPQALLRASLDRKLKRIKPWTQQDIVAEALLQWFKRNDC